MEKAKYVLESQSCLQSKNCIIIKRHSATAQSPLSSKTESHSLLNDIKCVQNLIQMYISWKQHTFLCFQLASNLISPIFALSHDNTQKSWSEPRADHSFSAILHPVLISCNNSMNQFLIFQISSFVSLTLSTPSESGMLDRLYKVFSVSVVARNWMWLQGLVLFIHCESASTPVCGPLLQNPLSKQFCITETCVTTTGEEILNVPVAVKHLPLLPLVFQYCYCINVQEQFGWTGCEIPILRELQNVIGQALGNLI